VCIIVLVGIIVCIIVQTRKSNAYSVHWKVPTLFGGLNTVESLQLQLCDASSKIHVVHEIYYDYILAFVNK
jgi:hypothetical protein